MQGWLTNILHGRQQILYLEWQKFSINIMFDTKYQKATIFLGKKSKNILFCLIKVGNGSDQSPLWTEIEYIAQKNKS